MVTAGLARTLSSRCSFIVRFGLWSTADTSVWSSRPANVNGTRSMAPLGLCVPRRATGAASSRAQCSGLGLFGEPKDPFSDDVALDLGRAAPDRLRPREEERGLQHRGGVGGDATAASVAGHHLLLVTGVAGEDLRVEPEDVHGQVHGVAVGLRPE